MTRRSGGAASPSAAPSSLDADILIVGAGCAGLSLVWHLMERGLGDRQVLLIDPRRGYDRDRTWCFWDVVPHAFEDLVSHAWTRWRVRDRAGWVERSAPGVEYQHLPADAFYERVLDRVAATDGVELRLGVRAGEVVDAGGHVIVQSTDGPLSGRMLFDSRPPPRRAIAAAGREVALLQHFEGWHVVAPAPAFDPAVATLMDFAVPQTQGIHFFYVLPYAEREALVEATWFGTHVPDDGAYRLSLERYLRETLGLDGWRVERTEKGALPMSAEPMPARTSERVYRIGLAGGMAKPSTGYAFLAIQSYSAEMARRLDGEDLPEPPAPRPWRNRFQDRVFLSYLARYPDQAPSTLVRLFEEVEPELLVRFLSDRSTTAEGLAIMRAMPKAPMTAEVVRSAPMWLRRG